MTLFLHSTLAVYACCLRARALRVAVWSGVKNFQRESTWLGLRSKKIRKSDFNTNMLSHPTWTRWRQAINFFNTISSAVLTSVWWQWIVACSLLASQSRTASRTNLTPRRPRRPRWPTTVSRQNWNQSCDRSAIFLQHFEHRHQTSGSCNKLFIFTDEMSNFVNSDPIVMAFWTFWRTQTFW